MGVIPVPTIARYDGKSQAAGAGWTGVVRVRDGSVFGSAVLHESGIFVITAAHVVHSLDPTSSWVVFEIAGTEITRDVIEVSVYPGAVIDDDGIWHDLALLALDRAAPPGAERHGLFRGDDEIGRDVYLTGYGPSEPDTDPARSSGRNTVDATGDLVADSIRLDGSLDDQLFFDYDSGLPEHDTLGDMLGRPHLGLGGEEAMVTAGDSGGGMFIRSGDETLLAGINSYMIHLSGENSGSGGEAAFGDVGVATRISSYTCWIDATTGVVQNPVPFDTPPPDTETVPLEVQEGSSVWFLVQLGAPAIREASVDFFTRDGTAEGGLDYIPTRGTLTLEPGDQWAKIWVQTLADDLIEGDETFSLVLTNPRGASFPDGAEELTAQRVIIDDVTLSGVTEFYPEL